MPFNNVSKKKLKYLRYVFSFKDKNASDQENKISNDQQEHQTHSCSNKVWMSHLLLRPSISISSCNLLMKLDDIRCQSHLCPCPFWLFYKFSGGTARMGTNGHEQND